MSMRISAYRLDHENHFHCDQSMHNSTYEGDREFWMWLCSHGAFARDGFEGALYVRPVDCRAGIAWVRSSGIANQEHWLFLLEEMDASPRMYLRAEF